MRHIYQQVLVWVTQDGGKHLWEDLVYGFIIDPSLKEYPKVISTEKEAQNANKKWANKRRSDE